MDSHKFGCGRSRKNTRRSGKRFSYFFNRMKMMNLPSIAFLGTIAILLPVHVTARTWADLAPIHGTSPPESFDVEALMTEADPLNTPPPTPSPFAHAPTKFPTVFPTFQPSSLPSLSPTTNAPTTSYPTISPTLIPSESPSNAPDPYPFNRAPLFAEPWYFNYDTRKDAKHGPGYLGLVQTGSGFVPGHKDNKWADVEVSPDYYWKEFTDDGFGPWKGVLANHMPSRNQCGRIGSQSPIDVRHNGLGTCEEHHEVRSLAGDFRLSSDKVIKEILPNKLRFRYQRRPCSDLSKVACQEPDPPKADFPNGWGNFADALHVDFKVPSEHLLNGKRYDAELQVFHLHKNRRRLPTQATLINATADGFNWYFDEALKAFQYEFSRDAILCASKQRRERQLVQEFHKTFGANSSKIDYETWAKVSIESEAPGYKEEQDHMERELNSGLWDPHHPSLVPSIYFYRYEGSLTEPPCGEWVSWFITDKPMTISFDQLDQLKNILFNHVDHNCHRTSVHYGHSVARPIQPTAGRPIYLCTSLDFQPDP